MQWITFPDPRIQVCGLPWFPETSPRLWRFPERVRGRIPENLMEAGRQTAGVRLRLRCDTGNLSLRAEFPKFCVRTNMTQYTAHGVSAYVDGECWSARIPGGDGGQADLSLFTQVPRRMREICLYLPLYGPVDVGAVGLDEAAVLASPSPFALTKPVLFYGTSITQGGCASRPGLSYQAIVGRRLNIDYANFGFSGAGRCEREVAEVLAEADPAGYVLDAGQNNTMEEFRTRFGPFLETLRGRRPDVPVLCTTPIFYNAELWSAEHQAAVREKRDIIRAAVAARRLCGDDLVHLLEAADYFGPDLTDGAVDGGHPNDLGFARMARGMVGRLAAVLGLPVPPQ